MGHLKKGYNTSIYQSLLRGYQKMAAAAKDMAKTGIGSSPPQLGGDWFNRASEIVSNMTGLPSPLGKIVAMYAGELQ